jgi:hypothetical protein
MATTALPNKLIGIIALVAAAGLGYWGYEKSGGLESQVSSALTGSQSDNVMLLYIGAAVCVVVGIFFMLRK